MNKRTMEKWVRALRSGRFAQGKHRLCILNSHIKEKEYCCLGVLNEICAIGQDGRWSYLEEDQAAKVGLAYKDMELLGYKNDQGQSFNRIASYIEKNYKKFGKRTIT